MLLTCWYSQTGLLSDLTNMPFYTITNLQGSQTMVHVMKCPKQFYTITNLQGSQTKEQRERKRFTPLQTYKVLKRSKRFNIFWNVLHHYKLTRFSNCKIKRFQKTDVLHHYKLTRFSNVPKDLIFSGMFYTITNLQGSQTLSGDIPVLCEFYTITNLQGSQTHTQRHNQCFWFYTITNLQGSQTCPAFFHLPGLFYTITNLQGSQTSNLK